jgi:hypothetical protein
MQDPKRNSDKDRAAVRRGLHSQQSAQDAKIAAKRGEMGKFEQAQLAGQVAGAGEAGTESKGRKVRLQWAKKGPTRTGTTWRFGPLRLVKRLKRSNSEMAMPLWVGVRMG